MMSDAVCIAQGEGTLLFIAVYPILAEQALICGRALTPTGSTPYRFRKNNNTVYSLHQHFSHSSPEY